MSLRSRISAVTQKSCRALRFVAEKMQSLSFLSYNWNTGDQMHSIRACLMYYFIKWNLLKYLFKLTFISFCENSQFIIPLYYPNCARVQSFSFTLYFVPISFRIALSLEKQRNKRTLKPNPSSLWKIVLMLLFQTWLPYKLVPRAFALEMGTRLATI